MGKADTMYSALSNEIEKCGRVGFGSDWASIIIGYKNLASKLKRDTKKITIHCHNNRFALAILPFFEESTFLMTNTNYLMC